jgi:hypothetical protein
MFLAGWKPKTTVFTMFLASGGKNLHLFGQQLAKTLVFTHFSNYFFHAKDTKRSAFRVRLRGSGGSVLRAKNCRSYRPLLLGS